VISHPLRLACREVVEHLDELSSLPDIDRVRLEQHLLVCPPCTMYLAQLREMLALAAELRE